jgi:hypothetical protein
MAPDCLRQIAIVARHPDQAGPGPEVSARNQYQAVDYERSNLAMDHGVKHVVTRLSKPINLADRRRSRHRRPPISAGSVSHGMPRLGPNTIPVTAGR